MTVIEGSTLAIPSSGARRLRSHPGRAERISPTSIDNTLHPHRIGIRPDASTATSASSLPPTNSPPPPRTCDAAVQVNLYGMAVRSNAEMAKEVAEVVRHAYCAGDKSSNKIVNSGSEEQRRLNQERRSRASFKCGHLQGLTRANVYLKVRQTSLQFDAGNCGQLASFVARQALNRGACAQIWTMLDPEGRGAGKHPHAFVVIGSYAPTQTVSFENADGLWVVDAWANVVCEAPNFTALLEAKMNTWAAKGKWLHDDNTFTWTEANEPHFIGLIRSGTKIALPYSKTLFRAYYSVQHCEDYPEQTEPSPALQLPEISGTATSGSPRDAPRPAGADTGSVPDHGERST